LGNGHLANPGATWVGACLNALPNDLTSARYACGHLDGLVHA
jgi:hypothetical protein